MAEVADAFVTLIPSFKGGASAISKELDGPSSAAGTSAGKTAGRKFSGSFGAATKSLLGPALALVGTAAIGGFLKDSIAEARESQKVGALTANVIKTTGGAAKISAKEVGSLATAISNKTGIDDEAVQSGSNLLLTFKNIKREGSGLNDVFGRATAAAVDLSASGFGDLNGASKQLGKALNDPIKGVSALGKAGVTFTDQQKAQIKAMVKSGDLLGAQKIVLKEVESQVKGSAAAQATAGEKAKVAYQNLKEQIGTALLPVIDKLANVITTKIVPAVSTFITQLQNGTGAGGKVAAVFKTVGTVLGVVFDFIGKNKTVVAVFVGTIVGMTAAFAALNAVLAINPFTLIVLAIAAFVAALVYAYKNSETFRNIVNAAFTAVKAAAEFAFNFIKDHWKLLLVLLTGPIGAAVLAITDNFDKVKDAFATIGNVFRAVYNATLGPVFSLILKGIGAMLTVYGTLLSALSHVPGFGWAKTAADAMKTAADKAQGLADKVNNIPKSVTPFVKLDTTGIAAGLRYVIDTMNRIGRLSATAKANLHASGAPVTAIGGVFSGAQTRVIAEAGKEAVVPLDRPLNQIDPSVRDLAAYAQGIGGPLSGSGATGGGSGASPTFTLVVGQREFALAVQDANRLGGRVG